MTFRRDVSTVRLRRSTRRLVQGGNKQIILVTGGGGFLGRHIVAGLLECGYAVRVLGRRAYPDLAQKGVDCRQGDIADKGIVSKVLDGVSGVIHTAALPGVAGDYSLYFNTNYIGTSNLIDASIAAGVRKFVYTSTPSVVHGGGSINGGDESLPYPKRHLSYYASTKAMAEKLVLSMNSESFATAAIRPHLMFGPGDTQLIPKILARARAGKLRRVGDGKNLVSVTYVENAADAHLLLLDRLEPGSVCAGQAYFINEPEPVNCWDFINRIVTGAGLPPVRGSIPYWPAYLLAWALERTYSFAESLSEPPLTRFVLNQLATSHWFVTTKAQRDFGWMPETSLDDAITILLNDLKSHSHE